MRGSLTCRCGGDASSKWGRCCKRAAVTFQRASHRTHIEYGEVVGVGGGGHPERVGPVLALEVRQQRSGPLVPLLRHEEVQTHSRGRRTRRGYIGPRHGSANPIGGTIVGGAETATAAGGAVAEADNPTQTREGRWRGGCVVLSSSTHPSRNRFRRGRRREALSRFRVYHPRVGRISQNAKQEGHRGKNNAPSLKKYTHTHTHTHTHHRNSHDTQPLIEKPPSGTHRKRKG